MDEYRLEQTLELLQPLESPPANPRMRNSEMDASQVAQSAWVNRFAQLTVDACTPSEVIPSDEAAVGLVEATSKNSRQPIHDNEKDILLEDDDMGSFIELSLYIYVRPSCSYSHYALADHIVGIGCTLWPSHAILLRGC